MKWPRYRPNAYQIRSAAIEPVRAARIAKPREKLPERDSAPIASNNGIAGTGNPICSSSAATNTIQ
jgi:hypothetical protein